MNNEAKRERTHNSIPPHALTPIPTFPSPHFHIYRPFLHPLCKVQGAYMYISIWDQISLYSLTLTQFPQSISIARDV